MDKYYAGGPVGLRKQHPEMQIEIAYNQFQHPNERTEFLKAMTNNTPVDLMSVDQIWLGEFAGKGLLTDISLHTSRIGIVQPQTGMR